MSSSDAVLRRTILTGVIAAAGAAGPALAQEPVEAAPAPDAIDITIGATVSNAYFFRGIYQEDDGVIFQPFAELAISLPDVADLRTSLVFGAWSSVHSDTDTAGVDSGTPNWFERDFYVGLGAEYDIADAGTLDFGLIYTWFTSPSDAFDTVQEVRLYANYAVDLGAGFSITPGTTLAYETGSNAAQGPDTGIYWELGVTPAYTIATQAQVESVTFSLPVKVGTSLEDYYQDGDGNNEFFGYLDIGAEAAIPLFGEGGFGDGRYGNWTLTGGVHFLVLGDALEEVHPDEQAEEIIVFAGVEATF